MAYHADTINYLSRLATAGGSISQFNTDLLDTKIRLLYAYGLRGATNYLKYWLQLNLTQSFTGCLIPVYDGGVGSATNNNFVSGDWSSALGLTGDGSTKYLDSNFNLATQLGTFSLAGRSDFHFSFKQNTAPINDSVIMGFSSNSGAPTDRKEWALWNSTPSGTTPTNILFDTGRDVIGSLDVSNSGGVGLFVGNVIGNTSRVLLNNSLLGATSGTPTIIDNPNGGSVYLFTVNLSFYSVPGGAMTATSISSFTMGYGLSTQQETALYNILSLTQPYYASPLGLLGC